MNAEESRHEYSRTLFVVSLRLFSKLQLALESSTYDMTCTVAVVYDELVRRKMAECSEKNAPDFRPDRNTHVLDEALVNQADKIYQERSATLAGKSSAGKSSAGKSYAGGKGGKGGKGGSWNNSSNRWNNNNSGWNKRTYP